MILYFGLFGSFVASIILVAMYRMYRIGYEKGYTDAVDDEKETN